MNGLVEPNVPTWVPIGSRPPGRPGGNRCGSPWKTANGLVEPNPAKGPANDRVGADVVARRAGRPAQTKLMTDGLVEPNLSGSENLSRFKTRNRGDKALIWAKSSQREARVRPAELDVGSRTGSQSQIVRNTSEAAGRGQRDVWCVLRWDEGRKRLGRANLIRLVEPNVGPTEMPAPLASPQSVFRCGSLDKHQRCLMFADPEDQTAWEWGKWAR